MKQSVRSRIPASLQEKLGDTPNRCGGPTAVLHPFNNTKETVQKKNPRPSWQARRRTTTGLPEGPKGDITMAQQDINPRIIHVAYPLGAGIDVHNLYVTACVAANHGTHMEKIVVQEFKRTPEGTTNLCRFLGKYLLRSIVMEATGVYFPTVLDALDAYDGWNQSKPLIIVINPALMNKYKGELHEDKADAFDLAKLGLSGLARSSYIPTDKLRELRCLTREIRFVDKDCTRVKNRIKRILALWGIMLNKFNLASAWALDLLQALLTEKGHFGAAVESILNGNMPTTKTTRNTINRRKPTLDPFATINLPESALVSLESYMLALSFNAAIMTKLQGKIEGLVDEAPLLSRAVKRIRCIPGLSDTSAAGLVAEIGNIDRFHNRKQFLKYVGCAPAQYKSGNTSFDGYLAPHANRVARWYLCTAGRIVTESIVEDSDVKEFARKQLNAHYNDRKLVYANTGIKIARIVYAILGNGAEYVSFHEREPVDARTSCSKKKPGDDHVILRTIRHKTKNLVKYLDKVVRDQDDPWYRSLAGLIDKLGISKKKAAKRTAIEDAQEKNDI